LHPPLWSQQPEQLHCRGWQRARTLPAPRAPTITRHSRGPVRQRTARDAQPRGGNGELQSHMASRRDELNAYTFAKRRMLAAFLQPSPSGSEEGAPRPLRAVLPSLIVGVLVLGVFGAWGMFKPTAPPGWDEPGARVIVGKQSTTRYVVLKTDGATRLHPVLNLASARLLMKDAGYKVVQVD